MVFPSSRILYLKPVPKFDWLFLVGFEVLSTYKKWLRSLFYFVLKLKIIDSIVDF